MRSRFVQLMAVTCALAFAAGSAGAAFEISIEPNPPIAGETARLVLVSSLGDPRIKELPTVPGLTWENHGTPASSSQISIINGRRTARFTTAYSFTIAQPGQVTLPPLKLTIGGKTYDTGPLPITAIKAKVQVNNRAVDPTELVKLRILYAGREQPPGSLYTGQVLPLTIELTIDARLTLFMANNDGRAFNDVRNFFPQVALDGVLWRDLSALNPHHSRFTYSDEVQDQRNGRQVRVYTYQAYCWAIEPRALSGTVSHTVPIVEYPQQQQPVRDPFGRLIIGSQGGRLVRVPVSTALAAIPVVALPPPPADASFLGLVGEWDVSANLSRREVPAGDDVTLTLTLAGAGNLEGLSAPALNVNGMNVYDPEVTRSITPQRQEGSIRWVIVPRSVGAALPPLRVAWFSPAKGGYEVKELPLPLTVLPGDSTTTTSPMIIDSGGAPPEARPTQAKLGNDIVYIKKALAAPVRQPLWQHRLPLTLALTLGGPLVFVLVSWLAARRARLAADPRLRRRHLALRQRRRLYARLRRATPEELPALVRTELVPHLAALLDLPPGSTAGEIRRHLTDPELATILEAAESGGYMPGASGRIDTARLLACLGRLACLALALGLLGLAHAADPLAEATARYDRGDYAGAAELYRAQLQPGRGQAELAYNLGNCAYALGAIGQAIAWYETARRLAPRDSDIRENLAFVRRQVNLGPATGGDSPLALLAAWRDRLRPDEWLRLAAICWALGWGWLAFARWRRYSWTPAAVLLLMALACLPLLVRQHATSYRHGQAVVIHDDTPLRRLPGSDDAPAATHLDEAEYVLILESRTDWLRVRAGEREGWLRATAVQSIW